MNSIDGVVRVAVLADLDRLSGSQQRLLDALSQSTLPGFVIDLPGDGVPVSPRTDLIHLLGGHAPGGAPASAAGAGASAASAAGADSAASAAIGAVAREHWIGLVASYPAVPHAVPAADCRIILSPGAAADAELIAHGARTGQLWRWQPGIDTESPDLGRASAGFLPREPDRINVLCVGTPDPPELLEQAFAMAVAREPRLRRVAVGPGADLPALSASADLLAHVSTSAEFPLAILEAQASGLPVLALDAGAAAELIEDGRNGVLVPPAPGPLAEALVSLARRAALRERLSVGGLGTARSRTWQRALTELACAWTTALMPSGSHLMRAA